MLRKKPKTIYRVSYMGYFDSNFYSLTQALEYVGRMTKGKHFGCMLVTARQASIAGFIIEQYKEFL